ncbi:MerR family transcriptional regulator [Streptomyces sp. NK15101]|uniref:MerR family transcriptional regulator n=1 Tax=Streptomyces sp. NK15101 TaxID=2873261 RepID=UPI001CECAB90|nr:MerR family transcriptional regulator [Streptomyces sp. NK15101]
MRIAELSRVGGVSTATIKYYIREGLLPSGRLTSSNQAHYTEHHVHRLRLIRALLDLGGLTVSRIKDIVTALDSPAGSVDLRAMVAREPHAGPLATLAADPRSIAKVRSLTERRGWTAPAGSPEFAAVVEVLDTLRELGQDHFADRLDDYAEAAQRAAAIDDEVLRACEGDGTRAESLVVGAALGDVLLSALRGLARNASATASSPALVTAGRSGGEA